MTRILPAALLAVVLAAPFASAQDEGGAEPPAQPVDLYEQTDRKKTMSIKLPRTWKSAGADETASNALAAWKGFYGEPEKSPNGLVQVFVENRWQRAVLARAVEFSLLGTPQPASFRQGPGWAEGCLFDENRLAQWRRYVEKNGRLYVFVALAGEAAYEPVHKRVQQLLDTATVPGEWTQPSLGDNWKAKKSGAYDVLTDVEADRVKSVDKACGLLAAARDVVAKGMPGKPFDGSKPVAWIFQNAQKFDDRSKIAFGQELKGDAQFSGSDRAALVKIMGENGDNYSQHLYFAGAQQYVWQYFGGAAPLWIDSGVTQWGKLSTMSGGKGKFTDDMISRGKGAALGAKRRLDQWFDVKSWAEIPDNDAANNELFAWQVYFRAGRGAKKYKKQFEGYLTTLRDTGDPVAARKAFDGVNFDEMLADLKAWAGDWK
jgi:hypothetical protein